MGQAQGRDQAGQEQEGQGSADDPGARPVLRSLSDVYGFFRTNTTPVYFVSPTPYNLLGLDEWVGGFRYISYFDSFDGLQAALLRARPTRAPATSSPSSR